jgi:hypothetical protein
VTGPCNGASYLMQTKKCFNQKYSASVHGCCITVKNDENPAEYDIHYAIIRIFEVYSPPIIFYLFYGSFGKLLVCPTYSDYQIP